MVQLAQANNIKVILSPVLPAYDFFWHRRLHPAEKIIRLNAMIKSYSDENNIPYVDYYLKLVDERKGFEKKYTLDGVHPNHAGYEIMDPLVKEVIQKVLGTNF